MRCALGPFYRGFRELDNFMAMDVAIVYSPNHKKVYDAPNPFDDLYCIGVV